MAGALRAMLVFPGQRLCGRLSDAAFHRQKVANVTVQPTQVLPRRPPQSSHLRTDARRPADACRLLGKKSMSHREPSLVVIAVDLLEEGLGVERTGRSGDAGDD
jgi:hypothetical protein